MSTATAALDLDSAPNGAVSPIAAVGWDPLRVLPDLFAPARPAETLQTAVRLARQGFSCDGAGVVLTGNGGGSAATLAAGADAARADAMQAEYHQGPAFDAVASRQPIVCPELRFDSRWRFWSPRTADLGFRSVLSLPLVDGGLFGALTLYSRQPSFFRTDSLAELGFAQQVSLAVAVAVEREQLERARDSRGIVGQAQGILMERYQITADQAFAVLRRYSSHLNQKLRVIAERVISERTLPELDHTARPLNGTPHTNGRSGYQA
jgi:GAF domain-containing protein